MKHLRRKSHWPGVVIGCCLLGIPGASVHAALPSEIGAELAMGQNLTGDECRLRRIAPGVWSTTVQRYSIFCEGWTVPSGHFAVVRDDQRSPEWWVSESGWGQDIRDSGECEAAQPESRIEGFKAVTRRCRHRLGWQRHLLVAYGYGRLYVADFLPNNAPLVERTLMVASGRVTMDAPAKDGVRMVALRALEEMLGKDARMPTIKQIGDYVKLREFARGLHEAGQYRKSELVWQQVLAIQERLFGLDSPALASTLQWMALAVNRQGREVDFATLTSRAELFVAKSTDRFLIAQQFINKGHIAIRLQIFPDATRFYESVIEVTSGTRPLRQSLGLGYAGLARVREQNLDWPAAEKAWLDGHRHLLAAQGEHGVWTNMSRIQLARNLIEQKKLGEARSWIDKALESAELMYGRTMWWATAKVREGDMLRAAGKSTEALDSYRAFAAVAVRQNFACYVPPCFKPYVDLLAKQASGGEDQAALREAFSAVQLTETATVNAAISQLAARVSADDREVSSFAREHQELLERQARARAQLQQETQKPSRQRKEETEKALAGEIRRLAEKLEEHELVLQDSFPRYAQLVSRKPVEASRVAEWLRPDEALLYFAHVDDKGYTFLLHEGHMRMHPVPLSRDELGKRVTALRSGLTLQGGLPREFDAKLSHSLYRDLVGPLLDGAAKIRRLVVVPSGPLLSLPPDVLVMQAPEAEHQTAWLVRRFALSVVPSVRSFAELRGVTKPAAPVTNFLGVGNPKYDVNIPASSQGKGQSDPCAAGYDARALVAGLAPLPESAEEVRAMSAALGGQSSTLLLEEKATKSALIGSTLETKGVIAFATHGILPGELKCESEPSLAMATGPGGDATDDGLLRASEIAVLKLNANLVILSACNTAGADGQLGGESLSGLVRAFFFAGARNVLATHWPIASGPTVELTTGMVRSASQGKSWPDALREAKLRTMQNSATSHPFFWGAFSLVGGG